MKIEYTQDQLTALARLYREENAKYQQFNAEAEDLLREGDYVQRERVLKDAGNRWCVMQGIQAAAEAIGIPDEVLRKAAKEGA
ncbi:MAG: hypothetical protein IJT94_00970 [Oscillibacter sp.]|nr:hypothetical protein [Oscillibacter sp.]